MIASNFLHNDIFVTDEDNPLIDRKYPNALADEELVLPQIYRFDFTEIPDFSQTVMQLAQVTEAKVIETQVDDIMSSNTNKSDHTEPPQATNLPEANLPTTDLLVSSTKTQPSSQSLATKIQSKTLSRRQAIAQAKAQAKQIEYQKQLKEQQRQAEEAARYKAEVEAALLNPKIHEGLLNQRKSIAESQAVVKKHAIFAELAQDLQTIQLPESTINDSTRQIYEKAVSLIQAADSSGNTNTDNLTKAIQVIEKFAANGITDALLRQALWLFEGNKPLNISQDSQQALMLLQKAASQNDNRAQKLLSKLYYAGHLVKQNSDTGKYWLELAAAHGHVEAIRITQGIETMTLLKQTQREETNYTKRMALGIGVLVILMLLIFVLVKV